MEDNYESLGKAILGKLYVAWCATPDCDNELSSQDLTLGHCHICGNSNKISRPCKPKRIAEIALKGKLYKFDYTKEEFITTATLSHWDPETIAKYATTYAPTQADFISDFTSDFCLNAGGFGCIHGNTKIYNADTKKEETIVSLWENKKAIKVLSHNGKKAQATIPVQYPKTQLFEVSLSNGKKITVTAKHRFLTQSGWKQLSEVAVGEQLSGYDLSHLHSNSESYLSVLALNVFHLIEKVLSFLGGCHLA